MDIQQQLYQEIETLPLDAQEKVLKMIHFLKAEIFSPTKTKIKKKSFSTLMDLNSMAIETGIQDLAAQHDHYLYGIPKR